MRGQSRRMSLTEQIVSTVFGFFVALGVQLAVFDYYHVELKLHENLQITAWFTAVSLLRGYLVRRFFNWLHHSRGIN